MNGETEICAKEYEESKDEEMEESAFAEEEEIEASKNIPFYFPKEYGTITEFYFMLAESIHYGFTPILKRAEDVDKMFRNLMKEKEKMSSSHPEYHQMKEEFENMKNFKMLYELTIYDRDLIKSLNNFFKIQFSLIKKWGNVNLKQGKLQDDPPKKVLKFLPEHFLTDMTDFWQYLFKNKNDSLTYFVPDDAIMIFEMAIIIINSPRSITNPYIAAKFIEVLAMIIFFEERVNWLTHFTESRLIVEHLMEALVKFYIEIEFSGDSGSMYYEKFHYRLDCSSVFKRLWKLKVFKEKFLAMVGTEKMEKFVNCLLNDTNHCLEEGISKLSEIKAFEMKVSSGELPSKEEIKNNSKNENICKANIQLSNECIIMVKNISSWAKESFDNEVFTTRMASSLNFVLNKIVGPH